MKKNVIFIFISVVVTSILIFFVFRWKFFLNEPLFLRSYDKGDLDKRNVELKFMSQDVNSNKYYFGSLNKTSLYKFLTLTIEDISNEQSTNTDFYINTTQNYVLKGDQNNVIKTLIYWNKNWGEVVNIVSNEKGDIFVHWVRRNKFDTQVLEEGIRRYSSTGADLGDFFKPSLTSDERQMFFSDERIKNVHIMNDKLYFYFTTFDTIDLYEYDSGLKKIFQIPKGEQYFYTEVIGNTPGNIYFTTDKSEFGSITQNKEINIIKNFLSEKMVLKDMKFKENSNAVELYVDTNGEHRKYIYQNGVVDLTAWSIESADDNNNSKYEKNISLKYSSGILLKKYTTYIFLILSIAIIIYLIRYIVIYVFQNRIYIIFKQIFILVPVILAIMMLSVFNIMVTGLEEFVDQLNEGKFYTFNKIIDNKVIDISQRAGKAYYLSEMLQDMKMYELPQDDSISQLYEAIDLSHVVINGENINGVYTIIDKVEDGKVFKVADTKERCTIFEENLQIGSRELETLLKKKQAVYKIYTNGNNISAMKPIQNRQGDVVGIYQLGMNYNSYRQDLDMRYFLKVNIGIFITTMLLILVIILVTFIFLRPLIRLTKKVNAVTGGNLDVKFDVRSRDEVGALNDAFNKMTKKLKHDMDHIMNLNNIYHRFVPEELIQLIDEREIENVMLGEYTELEICVINVGINDFYKLSEQMSQEESFRFINKYFKIIGPIIRNHGGIIERYYDTGAIGILPVKSEDAVNAALEIVKETKKVSALGDIDNQPASVHIAVHKGVTLLGIIGEEQRLQSSIVSDSLNLAEMIKLRSSQLSSSIIATEDVMKDITDPDFLHRKLGKIKISHREEAIKLYDIYEEDNRKMKKLKKETQDVFERAIGLYQDGKFYESRADFGRILDKNIIDNIAREYFYQSDLYYRKKNKEGWDGCIEVS